MMTDNHTKNKIALAITVGFMSLATPTVLAQSTVPAPAPSAATAPPAVLTPDQIAALTPDDIKKLMPDQIKAWDADHLKALVPEQLQLFSSAQIMAFQPGQIKMLTPDQINGLTSDQLTDLGPEQIKALTTPQIQAITVYKIKVLTTAQIAAFTLDQVKALTSDQIKALTPQQTQALIPDYLQSLVAGSANTATVTLSKVPLTLAHAVFASKYGENEQSQAYPKGPRGVLFLTPDELDNSVNSNNWARLRYGASTVVSQPIKGFIIVEAPNRVEQVYVYVATSDNTVDLTKNPYQIALSPKMEQDHYGDLNPYNNVHTFGLTTLHSIYPLLGVSVNTLGDTQATKGNPTTFLFGAGLDLGPYAGINVGLAAYSRNNSVITGPSIGFSLDLALLGKIFK